MDEIQILHEEGRPYPDIEKFTDKQCIATLSWRYTDARAEELIHYLKEALEGGDAGEEIELWQIWLDDSMDELKVYVLNAIDLSVPVLGSLIGIIGHLRAIENKVLDDYIQPENFKNLHAQVKASCINNQATFFEIHNDYLLETKNIYQWIDDKIKGREDANI